MMGVEGACHAPVLAALALCCISMLEVSVVGCVLLLLGLWSLLLPRR